MKQREQDIMLAKGYRYIISFAGENRPPIFAKTIAGVAKMMREDFPHEKGWRAVEMKK